ncbi:hypothetical protein [Paludibacterium denitrificans]|uniref:Uncharacterized protein n=1 Tax=Paludibacterium denitrificans TaxID=2675226 RepID=A0A844GE99_9NEIS|nr:hypothetical protein [Paludibacterium denitrificans]MTD34082.1 hypothetical protein [Paludibacterium denitrificans]
MNDRDVIAVVAKALEVLSASGSKAIDYSSVGGDSANRGVLSVCDIEAARAVREAVISLPTEQHLAVMWRVTKDNPRLGEGYLLDLTCFVSHYVSKSERFGRDGLVYWVRHWARHDGSCREAASLFGGSYVTHHRFYQEKVQICLDGWFIAAKGALEPVIEKHYERYCEAA